MAAPVVHRSRGRDSTRRTAALGAFVLGLLAGAVLSASVLWLASGLLAPVPGRRFALVAVAALGLLREAGLVRFRLPQNTWQVPLDVLRRGLVRGSLRFGFELGTGGRTYISATAPYVLAAGLLLAGQHYPVAALAGLGFGAGRATTTLLRRVAPADWDARLAGWLPAVKVGAATAILAAVTLLAR
jgi:hypothetical protein